MAIGGLGSVEYNIVANDQTGAASATSQKNLMAVGMAMTGVGLASIAMTRDIQSSFLSFDTAMTEVQALGGVTTDEFNSMRDAAIDLSKQYPVTAEDVANAMYLMVSVGYDYQTMMATMPEAARLATAGSMEMAEATNALINVMGVYGDKAGDASDITKVFANAVGVGKYEMTDFMSEIMKNIGVAAQLGISFSDLAAYNVALQNSFTNAEEAGTSFNRMMIALTDPSTVAKLKEMGIAVTDNEGNFRDLDVIMGELKVKLAEVGDDAERAGIMTDLFGTYGQRAALAIMAQSDSLPELKDKMAELNLIQDQTNIKLEGTSQRLDIATNKMDAAKIALGEGMLPATLLTADAMSGFARVLEDLPGPLQTVGGLAIYAGQSLAGIGSSLVVLKFIAPGIFTSLATSLSSLGATLSSTAVTLGSTLAGSIGIGLVAGLAGVWILLQTGILDAFDDLGRWIESSPIGSIIMDALRIVLAPIGSLGAGIIELVQGNFAGIGPAMIQPLNQAGDAIRGFVDSVRNMFANFGGGFGGIIGQVQSVFSGIGAAFYAMAGQIQGVFSQLMNAIYTLIQSSAGGFFNLGQNIMVSMINGILASAGGVASAIGGAFANLGSLFGLRAEGGPVSSGSPYIVGEKGPELFVPSSSGNIVPNGASVGGSGGGGGDTFVFNINGGSDSAETIGRTVMSMIQSEQAGKRAQRGGYY